MKKIESKKSRDTVPLSRPLSLSVYLLYRQKYIICLMILLVEVEVEVEY
jgi:hypothetical protein